MAHDLVFGKNKRNFSRSQTTPPVTISDEVTLVFSESEKSMLDKLSTLRMKAGSGDRKAIKQLVVFSKAMAQVKSRASKGDPKAQRTLLVLRESGLFNKPQSISMLGDMQGSSVDKVTEIRTQLRQLRQKDPKTPEDRQNIEILSEKLARIEAMSGIGAFRNPMQKLARRARRARKIANLKSRAASGDPRARARLLQMQQQLNLSPTPATTPYTPTYQPNVAYPQAPASYTYPPQATTPAPYYQDADGNFYQTQPQPGQSQPAIDVFVGHRSRRVEEEMAAEQEDRGIVGSSVCGKAIPHENYRVAVIKAAVKSAGGKRPTTKDYYAAKATVDKIIGKSGITIYMPGAKPGRRTL